MQINEKLCKINVKAIIIAHVCFDYNQNLKDNDGIELIYKNERKILKGTISIICCDNLEANSLLGLVESFKLNVEGIYINNNII